VVKSNKVELIVASTLSRALQTASYAFGTEGQIPFIAVEEWRERIDEKPCERRRTVSELGADFPHVDFSEITNEDMVWQPDKEESRVEMRARALAALKWLWRRPEYEIAVVTHSCFMADALFHSKTPFILSEDTLKPYFENCEVRSVQLWERESEEPQITAGKGKRTGQAIVPVFAMKHLVSEEATPPQSSAVS
jgi:broad specificity phosphatase PhoE